MKTSFRPDPSKWPLSRPPARDPAIEDRIGDLLSTMSLEEKVGQIIQADLASVTPEEARDYHLGAILNGGNSAPGGDNRAPARDWLETVDAFFRASLDRTGGRSAIPLLWGTDAVHGHNNIVGATIFPHNIGLGAAGDPALIRRIGAVTAAEVRVTGMDWTFAPTLAVVRDDRWGRTYESYSEDPSIVAAYAGAMVEGLQGAPGTEDFLSSSRTLATAKHFVGDGGTENGADQGNCTFGDEEMRDIHAAGYPPAIAAGVQVVMASFNSWHGRKMHGVGEMLRDVLVGRLGFDGFVVGDWNGHGQVEGCTPTSAAAVLNAGLDMFMAPDSWKGLWHNTLKDVREGRISMERLDEAVSRILRVKLRFGLFDMPAPADRPYAGDFALLGCEAHREVAREAVRKSQVLLKNDGVLPVHPGSRILICGEGADDVARQCGGWTISWQGTGLTREDFPYGQTVYEAISRAAGEDARVDLSMDGTWVEKPDVAIVVFGEAPYAEFQGDRETVDFTSDGPLEMMRRLRNDGIKVISVFLSGRPLWVNPELNASNAFIASFLPGTEANGIADLLIADHDGRARHDFTGRLSFSWPRHPLQTPLNAGDADYDPLFPLGFGLTLADAPGEEAYDEECRLAVRGSFRMGDLFIAGQARGHWRLVLADGKDSTEEVTGPGGESPKGHLSVEARDRNTQEDTRLAVWNGAASLSIEGPPTDFSREINAQMSLIVTCRVEHAPAGAVELALCDAKGREVRRDISRELSGMNGDWQTLALPLAAFDLSRIDRKALIRPFRLYADRPLALQIESVRIASWEGAEP